MVRRGSTVRVRQRALLKRRSRCKRRLSCCRDGHCGVPPYHGGTRRVEQARYRVRNRFNKRSETSLFRQRSERANSGDRSWGQVDAPSSDGHRQQWQCLAEDKDASLVRHDTSPERLRAARGASVLTLSHASTPSDPRGLCHRRRRPPIGRRGGSGLRIAPAIQAPRASIRTSGTPIAMSRWRVRRFTRSTSRLRLRCVARRW
jgi:hypothetical protein